MIYNIYPCCKKPLMIEHPSWLDHNKATFAKENCPHCGTVVWHRIAFINPQTFLEDEFLKLYDVTGDRQVVLKAPKPIQTMGQGMISVPTVTMTTEKAPVDTVTAPPTVKRGRGRPKGSPNKPKVKTTA